MSTLQAHGTDLPAFSLDGARALAAPVLFASALLLAPSGAATAESASIERSGDIATCCDPESGGFDSRGLIELTEWIRDARVPVFSILISRDGRLAYELYTASLTRNDAHYQMSVTKSVVSALVGIAIDHGLIGGGWIRRSPRRFRAGCSAPTRRWRGSAR